MTATRPLYRGNFTLPAVAKGDKPFILTILDHNQWEPQPFFTGTLAGGRQRQQRIIIDAMEIADCLLREWTVSIPGTTQDCRPGIWIVRDRVYLFNEDGTPQRDADGKTMFREANDAEQKAMWSEDSAAALEAQANFGNQCVQSGSIMAEEPKRVPYIPQYFKALATYYGLTPKWVNRVTDSNVRACGWCTEQIPSAAIVCPKCSKVVDFARYAEMEAAQQAAVARVNKGVVNPPVQKQNAA